MASPSTKPPEEDKPAPPPAVPHPGFSRSSLPSDGAYEPGTVAAGERASRLLPGCYLLLESVIEVLASDSAMEEDDMMVIDEVSGGLGQCLCGWGRLDCDLFWGEAEEDDMMVIDEVCGNGAGLRREGKAVCIWGLRLSLGGLRNGQHGTGHGNRAN